ncbi:MAG: restriction endonuclease subunit S [Candidatus Ozemobacteraceae bacterium]
MVGDTWPTLLFSELADNFDGRRVPVKGADRRPGPYPYYGASGIVDRVDGYIFDGDYLLIGEDGENMRTRQTPIAFLASGKFWVNNHAHIVRGNHRADTRFLCYALSQTDISGFLTGSTMPKLTQGNLNRIPIVVPPMGEQKAIANILGALDDKIELNRKMNATLEGIARALFQSWFVDFDPVRAKLDGRSPVGMDKATADLFPASFQESALGHIPQGWRTLPLYDTAKFINGAAFKSENFCPAGEGLPVIKIAELKEGIRSQTQWSQRQADPEQLIDTADMLYSWSGSPDTSLDVFLWSQGPGLLNQHIFKVVAPTNAQKRFVYYLLKFLRPILVEIARDKQTTGLGHVTIADMKRLLVCWPAKEVLAAFDQKIAPIFEKAFFNTTEVQTLATVRDTLLPKLLSGELRVKDAERMVSEVI